MPPTDPLTPAARRARQRMALGGELGANRRAAHPDYDGQEATGKARSKYWTNLEAQVDPHSRLTPARRRAKATRLFKANMAAAKLARKAGR